MAQNQAPSGRSGRSNYTVGIMFMVMGGFIAAIGTGLIHTNPAGIHAPTWMIVFFGMIFVLTGVWAIFQNAVRSYDDDATIAGWLNFAFAFVMMLSISILCLWIGLGPGERLFVQNVGTGINPQTRSTDPTMGRVFFSIFGILMSAVTAVLGVRQMRKFLGR
ncbi:MAG: hypothetical protein P4L50_09495 [Anaerolineaceae bacterium]|nr:hypothetical protein [Anaerolineaceae bacterium]